MVQGYLTFAAARLVAQHCHLYCRRRGRPSSSCCFPRRAAGEPFSVYPLFLVGFVELLGKAGFGLGDGVRQAADNPFERRVHRGFAAFGNVAQLGGALGEDFIKLGAALTQRFPR